MTGVLRQEPARCQQGHRDYQQEVNDHEIRESNLDGRPPWLPESAAGFSPTLYTE